MAVTHKSLRSARAAQPRGGALFHRVQVLAYGVTLILAAVAIYVVVSLLLSKVSVLIDDLRYGRPRTTQISAFVGHEETAGQPTHLMAINLNRQVMVIELPGGDAAKARTLSGPYLFGANEDLTPLLLHVQDIDGDGQPDLLLDIRQEQLVYLNRDGAFRLPTPEEQARLQRESKQ
ncbi:MAG TPA: hypothetical protein VKE41_13245 [Roseiflexaceae bacterium]|nr:hypothetical protein [Roseiflexaceae bacterium]